MELACEALPADIASLQALILAERAERLRVDAEARGLQAEVARLTALNERLDHIMACAIVDTAHIVATHALAVGDLDLARFAAETGYLASPYDDTIRLDLVAVDKASGEDEVADGFLADGIVNRSNDDAGPVDLPLHTSRIIRQRSWTSSRSRSAG